jgi:hypothetical protein
MYVCLYCSRYRASHSRFDSPVSCYDVSRMHGLHTAMHRKKLGSEEDGRILMRHAAAESSDRTHRFRSYL